ncbi:hypothetical protein RFI_32451 [Reticulomyxa filosa]|uniref:Uncharacterized protein n=1 Tax=Reticulomyxa filosa TaxID=46433 RepID=X6LW64_RETFI|nr:hypothetical protein RFI_32451 [Reticulomyxa filosa]|eukprot:ETO04945.1 hypothetical protein RFI_32451 [Reticulomyxa filosa]
MYIKSIPTKFPFIFIYNHLINQKIDMNCIIKNKLQVYFYYDIALKHKSKCKHRISLNQQNCLMVLLETFGNRIDKANINDMWFQCNQIFAKVRFELKEKCSNVDLNKLEEKHELKIEREMCLHVLWNLLYKPKSTKYHQIGNDTLIDNLKHKYNQSDADLMKMSKNMEQHFDTFGFQKQEDKNWICEKYDQFV